MGLKDWARKRKDSATVSIKRNLFLGEVKESFDDISAMAKSSLSPKEAISKAKTETFQEASERLGVSELQLRITYRNFAYVFYASCAFAFVCFAASLYYLFELHSILSGLTSASVMSFCLANAFKYSFRSFQIKNRKLCSVKDWWDRPDEWLPSLGTNGGIDV